MANAGSVIGRSGVPVDPDEFSDVTFSEMPRLMSFLLGDRVEAITFGDRVFLSAEAFDHVIVGDRPGLVVHELVHVSQWRTAGIWFLPRYLGQYLRFRHLGASHLAAYRAISYEMEAFAAGASLS
jgi:hypothetical protein